MSPRTSISMEPISDQCLMVAASTSTSWAAASTVTDACLSSALPSSLVVILEP